MSDLSVKRAETQEYQGLSMLPAFKQRFKETEEFLHKNEREAGESWEEVYFGCRC